MQRPIINLLNNLRVPPCVVLCLAGLGITLLPEGRHHEAGLASESQHQQQPVCLHEGESSQDRLSAIHSTAELRMRQQNRGFTAQLRGRGSYRLVLTR